MRKSLIIRIFVGIIGVIALTACASSIAAHTPDDNLNNNIGNAIYYDYGSQGVITHWKGLSMYMAAGSITPRDALIHDKRQFRVKLWTWCAV